jgi:hypothetical protein
VLLNVIAVAPTTGTYVTVFPTDVERPVASNLNAAAGQVQWVCTSEPAGRVRPTLAAFLLNAVDTPAHPMREIAAVQPQWLADVDHLAESAGGQVHAGKSRRDLESVADDLMLCVSVLRTLLNALAPTKGLTPGPHSSIEVS